APAAGCLFVGIRSDPGGRSGRSTARRSTGAFGGPAGAGRVGSVQPEDLADRLLRGPASPAPPRAPRWGRFAVGAFVAYHLLAILLGNLPQREDDLVGRVSGALGLRRYLDVTASWQRWNMFAPNPVRRNEYMKVVVTDADGRTWDVPDDIRLRRRYPYLAYDRRAKVSRRMMDHPWYQRVYGAWMCREWERTHGGRPARKLQLVWEHSKVP